MIGFGYDFHKMAEGQTLILGGVTIDSDVGTIAHSDGDVLLHSISDALLGASGMGDIGDYFPDSDPKYKDANSAELLGEILKKLDKKKFEIINIDATVLLEKPKLFEYKSIMKQNIADICGLPESKVNIKATTNEKCGPVGRGEGIAAYSVCQIELKS